VWKPWRRRRWRRALRRGRGQQGNGGAWSNS
jgi:hypothetical protein